MKLTEIGDIITGRATGRILVDGERTGAYILYPTPDEIEIRGLEPELPPNVRIIGSKVNVSDDLEKWEEVKPEAGLQVFGLLDPRVLITSAYYETGPVVAGNREYYSIQVDMHKIPLELSDEVIEFIGSKRETELVIEHDRLIEMHMSDWSAKSSSKISLLFEYSQ